MWVAAVTTLDRVLSYMCVHAYTYMSRRLRSAAACSFCHKELGIKSLA
jgi:hypothetical protein